MFVTFVICYTLRHPLRIVRPPVKVRTSSSIDATARLVRGCGSSLHFRESGSQLTPMNKFWSQLSTYLPKIASMSIHSLSSPHNTFREGQGYQGAPYSPARQWQIKHAISTSFHLDQIVCHQHTGSSASVPVKLPPWGNFISVVNRREDGHSRLKGNGPFPELSAPRPFSSACQPRCPPNTNVVSSVHRLHHWGKFDGRRNQRSKRGWEHRTGLQSVAGPSLGAFLR